MFDGPHFLGQVPIAGMGQGTPASGPGAPSGATPSSGAPQPASPGGAAAPSDQFPTFPFYGYPYIQPYGWPAATRQVCTERTDEEGNVVKECREEPVARPAAYPLVTYPSGLFWWW